MTVRVLVTGGRDYADRDTLFAALDLLHEKRVISLVIHGAAKGADTFAGEWAASRGVPALPFPVPKVDWHRFPGRAGNMRNQRQLDEGKPNVVVRAPGGAGTLDMVTRAHVAGVPVLRVCSSRSRKTVGQFRIENDDVWFEREDPPTIDAE